MSRIIGNDRGWVVAQTALMGFIALAGPLSARSRSHQVRPAQRCAGLLLMTLSGLVARRARRDLADRFTMSPTPLSDASMVASGIYAHVRHPMYSSVIIGVVGYACFWRSRLVALSFVPLALYLVLKVTFEERQLTQRFAGYAAFREAVPARIVPRVR